MSVDVDGTNALLARAAGLASVLPVNCTWRLSYVEHCAVLEGAGQCAMPVPLMSAPPWADRSSRRGPGARREEPPRRAATHRQSRRPASACTMNDRPIPELWEWAEYYCPWCYIAAVRLHRVAKEYEGRVTFRTRPFPLELAHGEAAPRDILQQEWWLAAIQEPRAVFAPYRGDDWPTTTLPAFEAAWCAAQQGPVAAMEYDLRVRRAFFGEARNIGRPQGLLDLAREAEPDLTRFQAQWESGAARAAVLAEATLGRERYRVGRAPPLAPAGGRPLEVPIALPPLENRRIVGISKLPCVGAGGDEAGPSLFERALGGPGRRP